MFFIGMLHFQSDEMSGFSERQIIPYCMRSSLGGALAEGAGHHQNAIKAGGSGRAGFAQVEPGSIIHA
jgi:hypothetical protein